MTKPLRVAVAGMGTMGRLYAGWMQQGRVPGAVFSAAYDPASDCAARPAGRVPAGEIFQPKQRIIPQRSRGCGNYRVATPVPSGAWGTSPAGRSAHNGRKTCGHRCSVGPQDECSRGGTSAACVRYNVQSADEPTLSPHPGIGAKRGDGTTAP